MALVAEEQMHFIPGHLRAESGIVNKQSVERFGSGTARQHHFE